MPQSLWKASKTVPNNFTHLWTGSLPPNVPRAKKLCAFWHRVCRRVNAWNKSHLSKEWLKIQGANSPKHLTIDSIAKSTKRCCQHPYCHSKDHTKGFCHQEHLPSILKQILTGTKEPRWTSPISFGQTCFFPILTTRDITMSYTPH